MHVVVGNMFGGHPGKPLQKTYFKGGSQHRNLLSHLGVIELEGDMRERERERGEYVHLHTYVAAFGELVHADAE
jgi:hypothetical protein